MHTTSRRSNLIVPTSALWSVLASTLICACASDGSASRSTEPAKPATVTMEKRDAAAPTTASPAATTVASSPTGTPVASAPAGTSAPSHALNADPATMFDDIVLRYTTEDEATRAKYKAAKSDAEAMSIYRTRPGPKFIPEFRALAEKAPGTPTAAKAWLRVLSLAGDFGDLDAAKAAISALIADHVTSAELIAFPRATSEAREMIQDEVDDAMRTVILQSPHKNVQAATMFALATAITRSESQTPEEISEARELLSKLALEYQGVQGPRGYDYGKGAERYMFELDNLQVGRTAPDFQGTDQHGVSFKLSDYRGKVVVLDFWGFWCPPCRAMIPHAKTMVAKLADEPFAFIGINSDEDVEAAKQRFIKEEMPWRQVMDGSTSGPLTASWNVDSWPAVYVLDPQGVIRFRDVREQELEDAVMQLLAEAKSASAR